MANRTSAPAHCSSAPAQQASAALSKLEERLRKREEWFIGAVRRATALYSKQCETMRGSTSAPLWGTRAVPQSVTPYSSCLNFRLLLSPGQQSAEFSMRGGILLSLTLLALSLCGCISGPPLENPYFVRSPSASENPLFVPQGQDPQQYQRVYDTVYDVAHKYFDIASSNMYAGEIWSVPRVSTGIFDWWHFESYNSYELWESTTQSIRRRLQVQIIPAEVGGYFVAVYVFKELEDPGAPVNPLLHKQIRPENPTDTRGAFPSTDPGLHWINMGRDTHLEELILSKLKEKL